MKEEDKELFIKNVNENRIKMYKTAIAILKNEDDANDAIQEALMSAYKSYYGLREKAYFSTWIIRILINKCYDIINKNKKIAFIDDSITQNTTGENDNYDVETNTPLIAYASSLNHGALTYIYGSFFNNFVAFIFNFKFSSY